MNQNPNQPEKLPENLHHAMIGYIVDDEGYAIDKDGERLETTRGAAIYNCAYKLRYVIYPRGQTEVKNVAFGFYVDAYGIAIDEEGFHVGKFADIISGKIQPRRRPNSRF